VHQIDINNVFLYGDLQETMYMVQPPGFNTNDNTVVCKLKKFINGLKQAPRSWFQKLSSTLLSFGFTPTKSDSSLFINIQSDFTLFVLTMLMTFLLQEPHPRMSPLSFQSFVFTLLSKILVACTIFLALRFHGIQMGWFILYKQNTYEIFYRKLAC